MCVVWVVYIECLVGCDVCGETCGWDWEGCGGGGDVDFAWVALLAEDAVEEEEEEVVNYDDVDNNGYYDDDDGNAGYDDDAGAETGYTDNINGGIGGGFLWMAQGTYFARVSS